MWTYKIISANNPFSKDDKSIDETEDPGSVFAYLVTSRRLQTQMVFLRR